MFSPSVTVMSTVLVKYSTSCSLSVGTCTIPSVARPDSAMVDAIRPIARTPDLSGREKQVILLLLVLVLVVGHGGIVHAGHH